jgi:hypothetical protein
MAGALKFENGFGRVFSDRICFNIKKSWFGGAIEEDFALRHVTSVRAEVSRNAGAGIVLGLIGIFCLFGGRGLMILGLVLIVIAVIVLIGSPSVTIVTAGGERRTSIGPFSQKQDAADFSAAVKAALFSEEQEAPAGSPVNGQTPATANTKPCPICAEDVKLAAVKCRFCGADLQMG